MYMVKRGKTLYVSSYMSGIQSAIRGVLIMKNLNCFDGLERVISYNQVIVAV